MSFIHLYIHIEFLIGLTNYFYLLKYCNFYLLKFKYLKTGNVCIFVCTLCVQYMLGNIFVDVKIQSQPI